MMKCAVILVSGVMSTMVVIHGSVQEGEDKTEDERTATAVDIIMAEILVVEVAWLTTIVEVVACLTTIVVVVQV